MRKKMIRKTVPISDLKTAPYNPPGRTAAKALKGLIDSMDLIGQLHPLTVSPSMQIIDGHRRLAAAKSLGWEDIECNIVDDEPTAIYASVNVSSRQMSGNDALSVWLSCPTAAPAKMIPRFNEMENSLGRELVVRIASEGFSVRLYLTAKRIARYCDQDGNVGKVVEWLLAFPVVGQVMKAMEAGVSPRLIMDAVKKQKPVKLSLAVA
jgi:hypothetical protein